MTHSVHTVGIIGAGAWGTALAEAAARAGKNVLMWAFESDVVQSINDHHVNDMYLPDAVLSDAIRATSDMGAVFKTDVVLLCVPTQFMGKTLSDNVDHVPTDTPLLICSKGIEISTGRLLSQVVKGVLPDNPVGVLCGPSFAIEVTKGMPTAVTLSIDDQYEDLGYALCEALSSPTFRVYLGFDVIGAQIGAAVKNVIAIASGIADGRGMGDNTRAAIVTRGLAEISRLGVAMGADEATFSGLTGMGDLMLTANAMQSRNFSLGHKVGSGQSVQDILNSRSSVSEGVYTAEAVVKLADKLGVDMPISRAVHETLSGRVAIDHVIKGLLARPVKTE